MYKSFFKCLIDFLAAFFGLLLLSPVFLVVMVALFFANQGKPFFFQPRPGKNERIFKIIKFKSMNDKKDKDENLFPDEVGRPKCLGTVKFDEEANGEMKVIGQW